MAWHSKGSVSVTLNSEAVLGSATDFIANVRTGDAFRGPDGRWYEITNVTSATVISIKPNYQGATASGQVYAVVPVHGYSKNLADQFRDINNQWGATLAGIKPWAVSSTGQQAQADMGISAVGRALNNASTPANALSYLGGVAPNQMGWAGNAMNTSDLDLLTVSGLYAHGTAVPSPVNNAQGYVLHMQHGNPDFAVQQWYQLNSATGQYMRIKAGVTGRAGCCSTASSTLSDWRASMHRTIHPAPSFSAAGLSVSTSMYATPTEPRSAGATPLPMWEPPWPTSRLVRCRSISLRLLIRGGSRSRSPGLRLSWSTR
ncbi:tail fiber protein [Pseudomonas aeruginosa]|nr:tail fiber protein [Pseudomonas aeruginosa]